VTRVVDELVEDGLRELADEETQTRLWQASEGPEVSSLIECTSLLWDDSGLATAMDREVVYSSSIDEHLRQLRIVLHRINPTAPVDVILASPDLADARTLAQQLLEELTRFGHGRATS
jgi:hypothetical protein